MAEEQILRVPARLENIGEIFGLCPQVKSKLDGFGEMKYAFSLTALI